MEQERFDRLTRLLAGGATTRRAGVKAALAALAGLGMSEVAAKPQGGGTKRDRTGAAGQRDGNRPDAQGPCKSTKRPDNICTKSSQCCTGYCDTSKGSTNKDAKGRCRYLQAGMRCKSGQQCAKRLACVDGACERTKGGVPTASACVSGEICAASDALCTAYTGSGAPGGTFCTLPLGEACTGDPDCT